MLFRNIVFAALLLGLTSGLTVSALQIFTTTPLIFSAEKYEIAEDQAPAPENSPDETTTEHSDAHNREAWAPEDGIERAFFTTLANVLTGIGFSLLMLSVMAFNRKANAKNGLLWGLAGFAVFFIAPGLGLQPEIPGMQAAGLEGRQSWWLMTVMFSAVGLALLVFGNKLSRFGGLILIALPHILGAPHPEVHGFLHPDPKATEILNDLAVNFIWATAFTAATFWISLGAMSGYVSKRFLNGIEH